MDHVDWNSLVTAYSKGGKVDQKAILDWFKSELVDQVEKVAKAEETKRNFEKNMVKAIHAVYDEAGTDILPRPVVIEYALRELDVPIAQHDEAVMKMTNYIIGAKEFGTMQGPKGGMVRCLGADGKPTKTFNENKESIKFGRIVRKKNATRSTIP